MAVVICCICCNLGVTISRLVCQYYATLVRQYSMTLTDHLHCIYCAHSLLREVDLGLRLLLSCTVNSATWVQQPADWYVSGLPYCYTINNAFIVHIMCSQCLTHNWVAVITFCICYKQCLTPSGLGCR
jgi:hypothetical protein